MAVLKSIFDDKAKENFIKQIYEGHYSTEIVDYYINKAINLYYNEEEILQFICSYIWKMDNNTSDFNLAMIIAQDGVKDKDLFMKLLNYTDISYITKLPYTDKKYCLFDLLINVNTDINIIMRVITETPIEIIDQWNLAIFIKNCIFHKKHRIAITILEYILRFNFGKNLLHFRSDSDNIIENSLVTTLCSLEFIQENIINEKYFHDILDILYFIFQNIPDINQFGSIITKLVFSEHLYKSIFDNTFTRNNKNNLINLLDVLDEFEFDFKKYKFLYKYKLITIEDHNIYKFLSDKCNDKQENLIQNNIYLSKECPVCMKEFINHNNKDEEGGEEKCNDCIIIIPCGHTLCSSCKIQIDNNKCPICREDIKRSMNIII